MKNIILSSMLALFITAFMYSQNSNSDFSIGDSFIIGKATSNSYKHIDFPRSNFITKKGGIANYNNIIGEKVIITSIKEKDNGKRIAIIKLIEPRKFFNSHKYVTVDIEEAIRSKELLKI